MKMAEEFLCLETLQSAEVAPSNNRNPLQILQTLLATEHLPEPVAAYFNCKITDPQEAIFKPKHRELLTVWMCQVSLFRETEVFQTAINVADRFFGRFQLTSEHQVQLVGATSLQLASKLHEKAPMCLEEVKYFTDDAYSVSELKAMETIILHKLDFDLISVTAGHFVDPFMNLLNVPLQFRDRVRSDTSRRINLALISSDLLGCKPSMLATAALITSLSSVNLCEDSFCSTLCNYAGIQESEVVYVAKKSVEAWETYHKEIYDVTVQTHEMKALNEATDLIAEEEMYESAAGGVDEVDYEEEEEEESDVEMDEGISTGDCDEDSDEDTDPESVNYCVDSDSGIQDEEDSNPPGHLAVVSNSEFLDEDDE